MASNARLWIRVWVGGPLDGMSDQEAREPGDELMPGDRLGHALIAIRFDATRTAWYTVLASDWPLVLLRYDRCDAD